MESLAVEGVEGFKMKGAVHMGRKHILLIDDELFLADIGKRIMEHSGCRVTWESNSLNAIELFKKESGLFDLIITGMTMPYLNGLELSYEFKKIRPDIPIILCAEINESISPENIRASVIREVIRKPIAVPDLDHLIREIFDPGIRKNGSLARILVADDDECMRSVLREMLERAGYEVMEASNGIIAMILQKENPADLVITDILMPEKEGIETILELKRDFPEVKIIAISGGGRGGSEEYLAIAGKMGAETTLAKPFMRKELLKAVRELLP